MKRKLKKLLLTATAVLMIGAMTAQAAHAVEFHSSVSATTISSTPDGTAKNSHHVIDAAGGLLTCGGAETSFNGMTNAKTFTQITLTANYGPSSNCTFYGQNTLVNMNGCDYLLHINQSVDIAGTNCSGITFEVPSPECRVTIGPQPGLGAVTYTNNATKSEITLGIKIEEIEYKATGSGCITTGHNLKDGIYTTGNTWLTGSSGGSMVNLWAE